MVKQVSLSEEAYRKLKGAKKGSESFSDVILRTVKSQTGDLDRFVGIWKSEDVDKIQARILSERRNSRSRNVHFGK